MTDPSDPQPAVDPGDLLFEPARTVAGRVRRGEISSTELTAAVLDRIEALNPAINAITDTDRDGALRSAAAADRATASGRPLGPLHGVPVTVKDALNAEGLHTTWGNPAFADYVADTDASVVDRLKEAGAVVVAKTNVPFMLADFGQTTNDLYGTTNNPWDLGRSPGGSSGGAAAALAAGLTFLDYGTDLVGSVRIPAGFCGVYGLRPSVGTVPSTGLQPPGPASPPSEMAYLSALGPLARSASDLRTALLATAGPDGAAAQAYSWTLAPPRRSRLRDFRVGVVLDDVDAPVTSEVGGTLSDAVDALARAGVSVVAGWPDGIDPARVAETFGFHVQLFFAFQQPGGPDFASLAQVVEQEARRMAARVHWARYFADVDIFLCPTNFTAAFAHDHRPFADRVIATAGGDRRYDEQAFWVSHAALPGLPAVSAPVGLTAAGLPVGLQIVGPLFEDDTAITFAELMADVVGGYRRPPGY